MKSEISQKTSLLFEEDAHLTGITEYGVKWSELTSGRISPGSEGARFDIAFEGNLRGPKITGIVKGIDFLEIRADGRFMLNIHATITTKDNKRIALREDGILIPAENGKAFLQLNMQFTSHHPEYAWMNRLQVWGTGISDMQRGELKIKAYEGNFEAIPETV